MMTTQQIVDACLPCKYCARKCFADSFEEWDAEGNVVDIPMFGIEWGSEDWPDEGNAVRIWTMCDEAVVATRDAGDKNDLRTRFGEPEEAVKEWNERFGKR